MKSLKEKSSILAKVGCIALAMAIVITACKSGNSTTQISVYTTDDVSISLTIISSDTLCVKVIDGIEVPCTAEDIQMLLDQHNTGMENHKLAMDKHNEAIKRHNAAIKKHNKKIEKAQ